MVSQKKQEKKEEMMNFAEIERNIMGMENQRQVLARVSDKAHNYINVIWILFD